MNLDNLTDVELKKIIFDLQKNNDELIDAHNRVVDIVAEKNKSIERHAKDIVLMKESLIILQKELCKATEKPRDISVWLNAFNELCSNSYASHDNIDSIAECSDRAVISFNTRFSK